MKKTLTRLLLLLPAVLILFASCERRPLLDPVNAHYIRVYLDEEILNVTTGFYSPDRWHPEYSRPGILRAVLCDPATGQVVAERFLRNTGTDERGAYLDGFISCEPGDYRLMVYNYDTEATIIRGHDNYFLAEAFTNPMTMNMSGLLPPRSEESQTIAHSPDWLAVALDEVTVPYTSQLDTLRGVNGDPYFLAEGLVDTYYLQIRIKGTQYVTAINATLSSLGASRMLSTGELTGGPVTALFDMRYTDSVADEAVLYTSFSTFGVIPDGHNDLRISFNIRTKSSQAYVATIDITDEFLTENAIERQWIIIDKTIVVPAPEGGSTDGGFSPGIEDWEDVSTEIII